MSDALAIEAIYLIGRNLRRAVSDGEKDLEARYSMAWAASVGMIARVNSGEGPYMGFPTLWEQNIISPTVNRLLC